MFTIRSDGNFEENDFRWIADWGFNFVRIPACYTLWIEDDDFYKIYEPMLVKLDRAIRLGQKYGVHICLNFHRAPGFSVNPERKEPFDLWKDSAALDAFCFHWELFAKRYKGIPWKELSFNLVNEPMRPSPDGMTRADHERVVRQAVKTIRSVDEQRLVIVDGTSWGNDPLPELADLGIVASCRAYLPMGVSHYKASWVGGENWPTPTWPGALQEGQPWDRKRLEQHYAAWGDLTKKGVPVHCGEGGAFNYTPHHVFLAWLRDVLEILSSYGIGYALWNFRGSFGVLDSRRRDVQYENWQGHQLDRKLLDLLQGF
jgi:endoglucanase